MPTYDYQCHACEQIEEVQHSIHKNPKIKCSSCMAKMTRLVSHGSYLITGGIKGSLEDHKETEHTKKVKDPDRAVKSRKKAFGSDSVGSPSMQTDPRHIVKRGRTLGGQQKEVDRAEFIRAAARDDYAVSESLKAIKKSKK